MNRFLLSISLVALAICNVSCGSQSKLAVVDAKSADAESEVQLVFTEPGYRSDESYFRDSNSGISKDLSNAKKIAVQNTRQSIAAMVQSTVKLLIENYAATQNTDSSAILDGNDYQELGMTVVDTQLNGLEIIGEKAFKLANGDYRYHVCMQLSKTGIIEAMDKAIEKDASVRLRKDKDAFREYFNKYIKQE